MFFDTKWEKIAQKVSRPVVEKVPNFETPEGAAGPFVEAPQMGNPLKRLFKLGKRF